MKSDELVSVIVPAYNHERFVDKTLQSLVAQTHQNLELILLDDGSTDETFARVRARLPELKRRFVTVEAETKRHEGSARTISRALELASGELAFLLDSDDVALPNAIEDLLPQLDSPDVSLAVGDNEFIDANGDLCAVERDGATFTSFVAFHTRGRLEFSIARDFGTYASLIRGNYIPNGWLLRRRCVHDVGGYLPDTLLDDWALLLRLAKRYRINYAGAVLVQYRVHPGNTTRVQAERMVRDTAGILLQEHEYCVAHDLEPAWRGHAREVFGALSVAQLEDPGFPARLVPGLDGEQSALVRALCYGWVAARDLGPPRRRAESRSGSAVLAPPAGSLGQRIHLYATCWNDVRMLPFFFRHYDPFVQRYVIFDDGSTDGSLDLLAQHPRVEVRRFIRTAHDSLVLSELDHYDNSWKESRGDADWVIVTDIDEHIVHADLARYLAQSLEQGVTVIPALGFEMVSEVFPEPNELLCACRTSGAPAAEMCKLSVFSPGAIQEVRYTPGGHTASPTGRVVAPPRDEIFLLHYKLLGMDYTASRYAEQSTRLGPGDMAMGWGSHWVVSTSDLAGVFERSRAEAVDVSSAREAATNYPFSPWWAGISRAQDWKGRAESLARLLEHSTAEGSRLATTSREVERQRDGLREELRQATLRVNAIEASRTWRWTEPVRRIVDIAGRLKPRRPSQG